MSAAKKIGLVVLLLAGMALAQAAFQLAASQSALTKGKRVQDAVPTRSLLTRLQGELEEEQLQIYALLASSKRVRGENVGPIVTSIEERLQRMQSYQAELGQRLGQDTEAALNALETLRSRAIEEFQKSAMTRDVTMAKTWLEGSQTAIEALQLKREQTISIKAVLDAEMQDTLSRMRALERSKLELSNFAAIFGGFVASRGYLGPEIAAASAASRARFTYAVQTVFANIDLLAQGDQVASQDKITTARLFQIADQLIDVSINGGDRPADANTAKWFEETADLRNVLSVASGALDEQLLAKVTVEMAQARFKRNASALAGIISMSVVAFSIMVVTRGVIFPLNKAIGAIDELAGGKNNIDVSSLPRSHEFGRMRTALEKLVKLSQEIEKLHELKSEQDEKLRTKEREEAKAAAARLEAEKNQSEAERQAMRDAQDAERRAASEVAIVVAACAKGDFSKQLRTDDKEGVFAELCNGLNEIGTTANEGLAAVQNSLGQLAQGDLTCRMDDALPGIFGEIATATNKTAVSLSHTILRISQSSASVDLASKEIATVTEDLSARSEKNAQTLKQTSAAIGEMAEAIKSSSDIATSAKITVEAISTDVTGGQDVMRQAVSAMGEIQDSSNAIEKILKVIDDIAFQTNLLALNAGVEAARAGDAGRGFAVVASEVRALAARSSEAASEIASLINTATNNIAQGVDLVNKTGDTLQHIVDGIENVASKIGEIHQNAGQTVDVVSAISNATKELDRSTQENAAIVEETSAAVQALQGEASALASSVVTFKTHVDTDHQYSAHGMPKIA